MKPFDVRFDATVDPQTITHRIVFNPQYGGDPVSVPGAVMARLPRAPDKPGFFKALQENIKMDGFRNPIILYNTVEGLLLEFGGSRLRVAQRLDKRIPAIVVDYTGEYLLFEEVGSHNWKTFFRDIPEYFEFHDEGVSTHYSMERNRRNNHDPAGLVWVKDHEGDVSFLKDEFPWIS